MPIYSVGKVRSLKRLFPQECEARMQLLRDMREAKTIFFPEGMTYKQLGRLLGVSEHRVNDWFRKHGTAAHKCVPANLLRLLQLELERMRL